MKASEGKKMHQCNKEIKAVHVVTYVHKMVDIGSIMKFSKSGLFPRADP